MNILLIGERYSNNLGDGVIFDTVENILKSSFDNVNIIGLDISGKSRYAIKNDAVLKKKIRFNFIHSKLSSLKRTIFAIKNLKKYNLKGIDCAVFAGGQLFSDYFAKQIFYISKILCTANIPIIFNSCGIGVYKRNKKYLVRTFELKNIIGISVRDNYKKFKDDFKLNNCLEAMDPVYEVSNYYKIKRNDKSVIGIGLMEPNAYLHNNIPLNREKYFEIIDIIINKIESINMDWEFFCNGNDDDYRFIIEVCKKMNYNLNKIHKRPETPIQLLNTVTNYKKIISFRLHSHIIASSYGIPAFGFEWDTKVKEYFKNMNNSVFCINLNNFSAEHFVEKIFEFLKINNSKKNYNRNDKIILSSEFLYSMINKITGDKNE